MEITVTGEIGEWTTRAFEDLSGDVRVRLNSWGGDVGSALTIYNRLKAHPGAVTILIEGFCVSAATVIACGGRALMARNALYMIHSPLLELEGIYTESDLEKRRAALSAIEEVLTDIYVRRTGLSAETIAEMMQDEKWLRAEEALALNFIDEIMDEEEPVTTILNRLNTSKGEASVKVRLKETEAKLKELEALNALYRATMKSGAGGVKGSTSGAESAKDAVMARVIEYGNRRRQ